MDIQNIINNSNGVMLVVKPEDLRQFAKELIEEAQRSRFEELEQRRREEQEEKFFSTDEVKKIFEVCDTTLWSWHKHGLLKHRKFGKRNMYALSDIRRFMSDHVDTDTVSGYAKWHGKVHPLE